jgi:tetraacyldisaccharide 4'-kinase
VGNLTVGGTGKTPIVECLARELAMRNCRVAILSRGYGGKSTKRHLFCKKWPRVVSDGSRVLLNGEEAGDEPFMLAKNLKGVVIISHRDRVKAARMAVNDYGCNMLILDDGFQYLKLHKQASILLLDKSNPLGNGRLLPRGSLREPISAMRRATHIILTRADVEANESLKILLEKHSTAPCMESCLIAEELRDSGGKTSTPLKALKGKRVAIFSGIANPKSFEDSIHATGAYIVLKRRFPDHYSFRASEIAQFFEETVDLRAEMIITTEKDMARLPACMTDVLPTFYLRIRAKITNGLDIWENFLCALHK